MNGEEVNGNTKVTYTVKELFSELLAKVGEVNGKLDSKASAADVVQLREEQNKQAARILIMETEKRDSKRFNAMWIPVSVQIVGIMALIWEAWPKK